MRFLITRGAGASFPCVQVTCVLFPRRDLTVGAPPGEGRFPRRPAPRGRSRISPMWAPLSSRWPRSGSFPRPISPPSAMGATSSLLSTWFCQHREGSAPASATSAQLSCRGLWRAALQTVRRWRSQEEPVPTESSRCARSTPWWQTPERNSPGRRQAGGLRRFDVSAPAMSWPQPPDSHGRRPWRTPCSRQGRSLLPAVGRAPGLASLGEAAHDGQGDEQEGRSFTARALAHASYQEPRATEL